MTGDELQQAVEAMQKRNALIRKRDGIVARAQAVDIHPTRWEGNKAYFSATDGDKLRKLGIIK
jgi:hypothetical protein